MFNGLYATEILDPDFDLERTVETGLKDFSRGTNDEPGSGYHMLDFADRVAESPDISRQIKTETEDIYGIRYRYEQWNEREVATSNGNGTEYRHVRTTDSVDVYWDSPNYLFIKGNKTEARQAGSLIESKLGDYIRTREIGFASDFLLWILSQYKNGEQLGDELSAKLLSNARIEGEEDRFGRSNRVDDSTDIAKATTILMGILRGKEMAFVEGIFGMHGKFVAARIETGGRIHIKAEQDIDGSSHLERMALSVSFLRELLTVYDHWQSLPRKTSTRQLNSSKTYTKNANGKEQKSRSPSMTSSNNIGRRVIGRSTNNGKLESQSSNETKVSP
ncbi:hypothetical protein ACFQH8_16135 [Halomicroarcula sp. GCM10025710]